MHNTEVMGMLSQFESMTENMTMPVIAGLVVGIAIVLIFSFISYSKPIIEEATVLPVSVIIEYNDGYENSFDWAKAYIFPRDTTSSITAEDLDWELGVREGVQFAYGRNGDMGASMLGIYHSNGTLVVPNGANFYLSPDLRKSDGSIVKVKDLSKDQKFGNGVEVGYIRITSNDGLQESIPAITFVVAGPDIASVDANIENIRDSIKDPKLVKVTIPEGASLAASGKTYEPQTITVVVGYNNTIRWVNNDVTYHFIEADSKTDLGFYRATTVAYPEAGPRNPIDPGGSYLYTFKTEGEIGFHGMPHLRGTVIVLSPNEN